jgi:hypothetical protein
MKTFAIGFMIWLVCMYLLVTALPRITRWQQVALGLFAVIGVYSAADWLMGVK